MYFKSQTIVILNFPLKKAIESFLLSFKPKHLPLSFFYHYHQGDIGVVLALRAVVKFVVGIGAVELESVGRLPNSKMQNFSL